MLNFFTLSLLLLLLLLSLLLLSLLLLLLLLLLNSRTLVFTNRYDFILRCRVNKTPHNSRTFQGILLVGIRTCFFNSAIFVSIPMFFNLFSRALAGVPRALTTNGTTVIFIFHTFFSFLAKSKYFSIFSTTLSCTLETYC